MIPYPPRICYVSLVGATSEQSGGTFSRAEARRADGAARNDLVAWETVFTACFHLSEEPQDDA
ncbi:MAG: hypothetical protein JNL18_02015 [Planctomycetaceae bacterium]|nr:hypothetical protein [Planctomycetaceae bacterium]